MPTTTGTFTIEMAGADAPLAETVRADLTKVWSGGVAGTSRGLMLSAGDATSGSAGYVAIEVFTGSVADRTGSVALLQLATMDGGAPTMLYQISPGSGTGELAGITGTITLDVVGGEHRIQLDYDFGD